MAKATYHHGDLRQSLLDEAAKIIREQDVEGVSIRTLACRVGVSRTALYHHFDDKHALLCALAEEGFKRSDAWRESGLLESSASPEEHIEQFVRRYLEFATANPEYYNLMYGRDVWKSGKPTESLKRVAYKSFRRYLELVTNWQQAGVFPGGVEPLRLAQVSWSTLHGMARLLIDGIYVENVAMEAICKTAVRMFLQDFDRHCDRANA